MLNTQIFRRKLLSLAVGVASLGGSLTAQSAQLEETIVTAQLRQESIQDVSVSVSVLDASKIAEAGLTKIEDLQAYVPNLTMSETGIGTNIYMRGIGSGINQGFEQSVGMYIDGVSYSRAQLTRMPFLDLERAEVLRGPQNILYGKNSVAGAISLVTASPGDEFEAEFGLTYEPEYNDRIVDLILSTPINDDFGVRLAHRTRKHDGFIENLDTGDDEPQRDESTTRLTFAWQASDRASLDLKLARSTFDVTGRQVEIVTDLPSPAIGGLNWSQFVLSRNPSTNPAFAASPASDTSASVLNTELDFKRSSNGDFSDNTTDSITLNFKYEFEHFDFESISASLQYEYEELCDCDFTSADIFFVESKEDYTQLSQEFRFTSTGDGKLSWIGGLYLSHSELDFEDQFFTTETSVVGNILDSVLPGLFGAFYPPGTGQQVVNFAVPREFGQDTDLYSAFVQLSYEFTDQFRAIVGARLSTEEKDGFRRLDYVDRATGEALPYDDVFFPAANMGIDYLIGRVLQVARHDVSGTRETNNFAPAVTVEYDLSGDAMVYASFNRGFKSGGYDARSNVSPNGYSVETPLADADNPQAALLNFSLSPGSFEYDQEESQTIELGIKSSLFDNSVELNVAAFRTEFEQLQVSIYDGVLGFNVGNAAEAVSQGIELDGRWAITDDLTMAASIAWLDFEFKNFPNGQCTQAERLTTGSALCDYDGFTNQYVADLTGFIGFNYMTEVSDSLKLGATLDFLYSSDYNPSQNLDPLVEQSAFTKVNARLALTDAAERWELALLGKNLTDEEIITYANDSPLSANLTGSIGHYAFIEQPRTVAVQFTYRYQ